ncbi:MAG: hypothetical protein ABIE92_14280, partial [bacterium]
QSWHNESKRALEDAPEAFGVFVDMRTLRPLPPEARVIMEEAQAFYKDKGMTRSVVILNDPITTMQFKNIAQKSGIFEWERYIDASTTYDWKEIGMDWVINDVDTIGRILEII